VHVATVVTRFQAGAGTVALRGAMGLDPDRFRVSVVAGSGDRLLDDAARAGFDIHLIPSLGPDIAPRQDARALSQLTRLLTGVHADVVHTHSAKAGMIGRLAARRAGTSRIVHTYHGFPFHEFQSAARRAAYVQIERRLGRITDVGLCVGTGVAVEAVRRGLIAPERIRTIGVAVDDTAVACTPEGRRVARETLGIEPGHRVVGAVGRLAYQKAPEDFVTALVAMGRPDVVGVWIGDGELRGRMQEAVERAAGRVRVILAGERADVASLLPAFDVFALPSRYEGLPVAIVEAMVCGIPVVATAVNAVSDAVVPGVTGLLVPPQRPDLFAGAVGYLLDHPDEAVAMAVAARARVGGRHNDDALAHALTAAYLPAAARAAQPADLWADRDFEEHSCA
jgi:glycosyltransferase involved in cell wall biosynthesis